MNVINAIAFKSLTFINRKLLYLSFLKDIHLQALRKSYTTKKTDNKVNMVESQLLSISTKPTKTE